MWIDYNRGELVVSFDTTDGLLQFGFGSINIVPLLVIEGFRVDVDPTLQGLFDYWSDIVSVDDDYEFDGNSVNIANSLTLNVSAGDIPEWNALLEEWKVYYGTSKTED